MRNITQEVSNLIVTKLWKKFVVFPKTEEEFLNSINAMETLWQFPTTFGGVDGCHIPLKCPHGGNKAKKEYHNFKNFYSVVLMVIVGADHRFLWASGDSAFPHHTWLHRRARMVTEFAFGQLKGRWRALYRKYAASQEFFEINILACIVLHNICIEKGDLITQNLDFTYDSVTDRKRSSEELRDILNMVTGAYTVENSKGAQSVRKALADYFWEQKEFQ